MYVFLLHIGLLDIILHRVLYLICTSVRLSHSLLLKATWSWIH